MPAPKSKPIDPWALMDAIIQDKMEPTGKGWFTIDEFMSRYNLTHSRSLRKLNAMVANGMVDSWRGIAAKSNRTTRKFKLK